MAVGPTSREEDLDRLAHMKGTLWLMQQMRETKASCQLTSKTQSSRLGIVKALAAGEKYHKNAEMNPGMNCGPPHVLVWRDFVKGTLAEIADGEPKLVEGANPAQIEAHSGFTLQHVEDIKEHALHLVTPSTTGRLILCARVKECKNREFVRSGASVLTFAFMPSAEKAAVAIMHYLVAQGGTWEQGPMPRTPIERELQEAVDRLEKRLGMGKGKGGGKKGKK
jgi:hypothetical protein